MLKKYRTAILDVLAALPVGAAILYAALLAFGLIALPGCAGPSPWLKPQGELLQLERQARDAHLLASDPRTRAALALCVTSAQEGVHAIDDLLQALEKLRQAKKAGAAIPELERSVARATSDAEDAEAQARLDCGRAGVRRSRRVVAVDGGADGAPAPAVVAPSPDGGAHAAPDAGARDAAGGGG